jgi:hypothetical protein
MFSCTHPVARCPGFALPWGEPGITEKPRRYFCALGLANAQVSAQNRGANLGHRALHHSLLTGAANTLYERSQFVGSVLYTGVGGITVFPYRAVLSLSTFILRTAPQKSHNSNIRITGLVFASSGFVAAVETLKDGRSTVPTCTPEIRLIRANLSYRTHVDVSAYNLYLPLGPTGGSTHFVDGRVLHENFVAKLGSDAKCVRSVPFEIAHRGAARRISTFAWRRGGASRSWI